MSQSETGGLFQGCFSPIFPYFYTFSFHFLLTQSLCLCSPLVTSPAHCYLLLFTPNSPSHLSTTFSIAAAKVIWQPLQSTFVFRSLRLKKTLCSSNGLQEREKESESPELVVKEGQWSPSVSLPTSLLCPL